jgi:D-glycero-D-manno-heptose 1,7-bisphosphate phosphatase
MTSGQGGGTSGPGRPAVFLDRDGVLLQLRMRGDSPHSPPSPDEIKLVEGAAGGLDRLRAAGFATIVVSNQPEIARGQIDESTVQEIHRILLSQLALDAVHYCPHDNDDRCDCRKPKAGMIFRAAAEWGIDLRASYLIGDRWVDLGAAEAAGIQGVLVETPYSWDPTSAGPPAVDQPPRFVGRTLTECVDFILRDRRDALRSDGGPSRRGSTG